MDLEGSIKSYSPLYGWTRRVGLEKLWEKANPQPVALTSKTGSGLHKKTLATRSHEDGVHMGSVEREGR